MTDRSIQHGLKKSRLLPLGRVGYCEFFRHLPSHRLEPVLPLDLDSRRTYILTNTRVQSGRLTSPLTGPKIWADLELVSGAKSDAQIALRPQITHGFSLE